MAVEGADGFGAELLMLVKIDRDAGKGEKEPIQEHKARKLMSHSPEDSKEKIVTREYG